MYQLNDDQKMFLSQMRRMVNEKVAPRATGIDKKGEFPWDVKKVFQEMETKVFASRRGFFSHSPSGTIKG